MSGGVGTNIEDLRTYGQHVAGNADKVRGLELAQSYTSVSLPNGEAAQALMEAGELFGSVADHAHERFSFAGAETVADAGTYERVEERHAGEIDGVGEQIAEFRW
ncbi:MAG: hypothetical protein ACRC20_03175 [Segniliparus sp.]|uniref:hypothetical protein n=1 Tax=Segniliparus sp. TaxID=2804064 RepID=UPI003F31CDD7